MTVPAQIELAAHYAAVRRRIATAALTRKQPPAALPQTLNDLTSSYVEPENSLRDYDLRHRALPKEVKRVLLYVMLKHQVSTDLFFSSQRVAHAVHARQEASWRLCEIGAYSMPQVAMWLGGRDHTTILHGIKSYRKKFGERVMPKCAHSLNALAAARGVSAVSP